MVQPILIAYLAILKLTYNKINVLINATMNFMEDQTPELVNFVNGKSLEKILQKLITAILNAY